MTHIYDTSYTCQTANWKIKLDGNTKSQLSFDMSDLISCLKEKVKSIKQTELLKQKSYYHFKSW